MDSSCVDNPRGEITDRGTDQRKELSDAAKQHCFTVKRIAERKKDVKRLFEEMQGEAWMGRELPYGCVESRTLPPYCVALKKSCLQITHMRRSDFLRQGSGTVLRLHSLPGHVPHYAGRRYPAAARRGVIFVRGRLH